MVAIRSRGACVYLGFLLSCTCAVTASYLDILLLVLKSFLAHESRRIGGGRNKFEVSLLECALFREQPQGSDVMD